MRSHVVGTVPEVDLQILVAKYFLILAKNRVCETGVEC